MKAVSIKKRINHDSMWIQGTFPSGGYIKYTVRRYETKLEFAGSNDDDERREQLLIFKTWIKNNLTTYGELFEKLEELCMKCQSVKELITLMHE